MPLTSPMIRLAPLQLGELPSHSAFNPEDANGPRPDLLAFTLALLDQGRAMLQPTAFALNFKHHSVKPSPPSNNDVEVLSSTVSADELVNVRWDSTDTPRTKPRNLAPEYWYARRSRHRNLSVKRNAPGTASWSEFVYGIRDQHSKHEYDFTPTIYDAHLIIDWNDQMREFEAASKLQSRKPEQDATTATYSQVTMAIYEMCHKMPTPLSPRCFPVLVITASVSSDEFVAVTVPVNISSFDQAFYSNGRNRMQGLDSQMRKEPIMGVYCAVERVAKYVTKETSTDHSGRTDSRGDDDEEIEWIMATASDTRGSVPMGAQRMGVPSAISKDVGMFLKWIKTVPETEIQNQVPETPTARPM